MDISPLDLLCKDVYEGLDPHLVPKWWISISSADYKIVPLNNFMMTQHCVENCCH